MFVYLSFHDNFVSFRLLRYWLENRHFFFPADCMGEILTLESGNEVAMETGNSAATHKYLYR